MLLFLGYNQKLFSRSIKAKKSCLFFAICIPSSCWTIIITFVLHFPDKKPNCISSTVIVSLVYFSLVLFNFDPQHLTNIDGKFNYFGSLLFFSSINFFAYHFLFFHVSYAPLKTILKSFFCCTIFSI